MEKSFRKNGFDYLILGLVFLIPLMWSKYLNANYYSAKFFLVYLVSSLSLFASSRRLVWPRLPKTLAVSLVALVVLHLISPMMTGSWVHVFYMFKFLSFAFLSYYFYSIEIDLDVFLKKFDYLFFVVAFLVLAFAMNDVYLLRFIKLDTTIGSLLGSFGNVNMLSEFLILTLPFLHLWLRTKTNVSDLIKSILLLGWFFLIFYCRSRSSWIGLGLWAAWSLTYKKLGWKEAGLLLASFIFYHALFLGAPTTDLNVGAKVESFRQRFHLYVTTLELIKDHPFGVGVGQFFNQIIPYLVNSDFKPMEYVYFDQPHSEILKWAAQFGWVGFILPAIVFGYLGFLFVKTKNFFLSSSFVVLLPQLVFQFPFENPASLMYLAFLFALSLKLFPVVNSVALSFKKRIVFGIVAVVGILHAFAFVTSIFWETSHGNDLQTIVASCEMYPVNINACFNRVQYLLGNNRFVEARLALAEDFQKFPFHAGLMRLLPSFLKSTSTDQKTCEAVLEYNYIFYQQTFFKADLLKSCSVFQLPVTHHSPEQFETDYLNWQKSLLR